MTGSAGTEVEAAIAPLHAAETTRERTEHHGSPRMHQDIATQDLAQPERAGAHG